MRRLVIWSSLAACAACGGAAPSARAPAEPGATAPAGTGAGAPAGVRADEPPAVDPIAALAPARDGERISWLVPGRAQLELGGVAVEAPGDERALEVGVIGRQGRLVRAAVRLAHARFSVWTDRAHLLPVLSAERRVGARPAHGRAGDVGAVLRAGAPVRRLARKDGWTHVRFTGAVEVEGWLPDGALGEDAPRRPPIGRLASGRRPLLVIPGAVIRAEPRWASRAIATVAGAHVLDTVRELEPPWIEVAYADGDVSVRGYLSKRDPPGRVHRPKGPDVPPPTVAPNGKAASGTCLYARAGGEPIGYLVGDRAVELEDAGRGWWSLAIDTPWGPIAFAARGPARGELSACAPPGSAPPRAGAAPAPAP